jgi:hypothetical protein
VIAPAPDLLARVRLAREAVDFAEYAVATTVLRSIEETLAEDAPPDEPDEPRTFRTASF